MSDEKINRIDRRLAEQINITSNLVVAVRGLNEKYEILDGKVETLNDKFETLNDKVETLNDRFDRLENQQKVTDKKADRTNEILEDALMRIIDLQKGQNEIIPRMENLEERVEIIEDKIAA